MHIADLLTIVPIFGMGGPGYRGTNVGGKIMGGKMSRKQLGQISRLRDAVAAGGPDASKAQQRLDRLYEAADDKRRQANNAKFRGSVPENT
jgi:hypothetical protein